MHEIYIESWTEENRKIALIKSEVNEKLSSIVESIRFSLGNRKLHLCPSRAELLRYIYQLGIECSE